MAPPIRSTGTISADQIRSDFAELAKGSAFSCNLIKNINTALSAYDAVGQSGNAIKTLTFQAQSLPTAGGSSFALPTMTFIGYNDKQIGILNKFMDIVGARLETDGAFQSLRAVQNWREVGGESLLLLNSPKQLSNTLTEGAKGGTAPYGNPDPNTGVPDRQLEIITESLDLKLGEPADVLRFLDRVFHETLHKQASHYNNAYDTSRSLLDNLRDPITSADAAQLDATYGGMKELMERLAPDLRDKFGIKQSEIKELYESSFGTGGPQTGKNNITDKYNERRLNDALKRAVAIQGDPTQTLDRPTLDELVRQKLFVLVEPTDPAIKNDPVAYEDYKNKETSYVENLAIKGTLSKEGLNQTCIIEFGPNIGIFDTLEEAVNSAIKHARAFLAEFAGEIGQTLGSTLGRQLARHENQATQIGASTVLGVVGLNLGEALEELLKGNTETYDLSKSFDNVEQDLRSAGIGAISSLLTAELFEELGAEGTLAELGQSIFAAELGAVITALVEGTSVLTALKGVNVGNLVGGFVGTKLAAELVEFDTIAGQIGASVGTAIGAMAGAKIGLQYGSVWGPIGAAIGAFVGYILGGLIGSFFGETPKSGADIGWSYETQRFGVTYAWARGGAPKEGARSIATNAAELLNSTLSLSGATLLEANRIEVGSFGTYKKDFVYRTTDASGRNITALRTRQANTVINYGAALAIAQMLPRMAGGDVYAKRAIAATFSLAGLDIENMPAPGGSLAAHIAALTVASRFDANALLGNISTAKDYADYLRNRDILDVLIAAEPDSAFTAGWTITFARAIELGLMKRAITDWVGGWNLFLDQALDQVIDGVAFTGAHIGFALDAATRERLFAFYGDQGQVVGVLGDTINTAGKDHIVGTAGNDAILVSDNRIADTTGLTINGVAATGAAHVINVAATIDGGAGDDLLVGGNLGNDLLGGAGNDTLVGGKLDDWLFGGDGDDRLFAGAANYQFADWDATAAAAALNVASNGDMLDGGAGSDVLYGSRGSDALLGGDGNDLIYGGDGGDIIDGGAGNDSGPGNSARLFGGGGTDQYVFAYGSGIDVVFDEADSVLSGGFTQDSVNARLQQIQNGSLPRNWAGGGNYEVDGSVKGGEDAVSFGAGIGMQDLILQRSGNDLVIKLTYTDPATQVQAETGDQIIIKDWFETTRRVEWLRFADGEEVRIGDVTSFIVGSSGSDIIIGTHESDFLYGGAGNDVMYGLDGDDFGFGGMGNDLVAGDNDNDWVAGGLGDDKVIGGAGNDTVFGDNGNDEVYGGTGSDIVVGGRGNDLVVGGGGDDIFRFQRGDGRDIVFDDYVNNWEVVWQNDVYLNGYTFDPTSNSVSRNGQVFFDGSQWAGQYDFDYLSQTFRRHLGAINGVLGANSGTDYLEFGVGIDIQDLMMRRVGNDLQIAITQGDSDATPFDAIGDRITIRDWYATGNPIENFIFVATGRHQISGWNITGATDGADIVTGGSGIDWLTGNGGDDTLIGNGGNDILSGNGGADWLRGGLGADVLYGGEADDVLEGVPAPTFSWAARAWTSLRISTPAPRLATCVRSSAHRTRIRSRASVIPTLASKVWRAPPVTISWAVTTARICCEGRVATTPCTVAPATISTRSTSTTARMSSSTGRL